MKTAIELSLMENKISSIFELSRSKRDPLSTTGTTSPTTSSGDSAKASTSRQQPTKASQHDSWKSLVEATSKNESLSLAPYEPFYVSGSNEKDVSLILKNMKNVVYSTSSAERKVSKICNFDVKEKAPV